MSKYTGLIKTTEQLHIDVTFSSSTIGGRESATTINDTSTTPFNPRPTPSSVSISWINSNHTEDNAFSDATRKESASHPTEGRKLPQY